MLDKSLFEIDIKSINSEDSKYIDPLKFKSQKSSFRQELETLEKLLFIQPNDPWVIFDDKVIRLPFAPLGTGLFMSVCAFPIVRMLGGKMVKNSSTGEWKPSLMDKKTSSSSVIDEDKLITLTIAEIVIPLKMGILISLNGSVYIGSREELSKIDPPDLDDEYRLILHPYRDEALFYGEMIVDEWGMKRPKYNPELAIRSLALSKASYTMRIQSFITDGWLDYTLIHEGEIKATEEDWNLEPSKAKLFLSTIRQLLSSTSAKAVVMGRPTTDGKAIINITFTGTKHTPDWLNNIKVSVSNKLHKGFYELASQFDSIIGDIHFTRLSSTLGLEDLTLSDIIAEASSLDSKYKLWITGHSQGGALTQVYVSEFLIKRGVLPENIFAYSFASPLLATAEYSDNPGDFPIYNIISADDFACRVGSAVRLGMDLIYFPDEEFRKANYKDYILPEKSTEIDNILKLCYWMNDSYKFGEYMIAMATFGSEYRAGKDLIEWIEDTPVLKSVYSVFKEKNNIFELISKRMYKLLEKPYMDVGGKPPSEERIKMVRKYIEILYKKWGPTCITDCMYITHQIPYNYARIVLLPQEKLTRAVWTATRPAYLLDSSGENLMKPVDFPKITDEEDNIISIHPQESL